MAKTSVSKLGKAARMAEMEAAQKGGVAWAQLFIDRYLNSPSDQGHLWLQGWIHDANNLFKDDPDELRVFYETLQKGCLKSKSSAECPALDPMEGAEQDLRHIRAQCDLMFTYVATGGDAGELLDGTLSSYLNLMMQTCDSLSDRLSHIQQLAKVSGASSRANPRHITSRPPRQPSAER